MATIWIVSGESGSYSDHMEWTVKAFVNKAVAETYLKKTQERANELCKLHWRVRLSDNAEFRNEYDPHMVIVDDEVDYIYYPVELDQTELS